MNKIRSFIGVTLTVFLLLSGCNLGVSPAPELTEPPVQPPATEDIQPTATLAIIASDTAAPSLITIDLAGPPMEIGSRYTYVDGTVLVAIPSGTFVMGYNFADNPVREVSVGDFWVYSTKVTNAQYALCVQQGKCASPNQEDNPDYSDPRFYKYPVTGVTHTQAADYCSFVHGRLPTEAEWEKTARGPEGNIFPWGDEAPGCNLLNYKFCTGKTSWVNEYKKGISFYGAFDMSGNAREWVVDWYSPTYNIESPIPDPLGPDFGEKRSVRGSSYQDSADPSISAHRFSLDPEQTLPDLGFRCVVENPTYFAPWCEQLTFVGGNLDGSQPECEPTVNCNDVDVNQAPNCTANYQPYTIVTFNVTNTPPTDHSFSLDGCLQDPNGDGSTNKYLCYPGDPTGPALATGACTFDVPAGCSTCAAHYNKVGDACVWDGSGTGATACLPGSTYDPVNQCCTSMSGSGNNYSLCPAGSYLLNGACVDTPTAVVDSVIVDVLFNKCTPPSTGGKDPGDPDDPGGTLGCSVPTQDCSLTAFPSSWDTTLCCCNNPFKGCQ